MVKNMPAIRDWYIRKYHFTDECDYSNYFAKILKQASTEYLRQSVSAVKEKLVNRATEGKLLKDVCGYEVTTFETPQGVLSFFLDQLLVDLYKTPCINPLLRP